MEIEAEDWELFRLGPAHKPSAPSFKEPEKAGQ